MKNLVTKKRIVDFKMVEVSYSCSAIMTRHTIVKMEYPVTFTIPCTIGEYEFVKTLCDPGESIKLMPSEIFKKLGLGSPKPTIM